MRIASVAVNDFSHLDSYWKCEGVVINSPEELQKDDILLMHGGGDISPSYYNQGLHPKSHASKLPSDVDKRDWAILGKAVDMDLRIFGLCRGAQWLCIKAGGKLVQHMDGHGNGYHPILLTDEDEVIWSNSSHHQMMYVNSMPGKDREILAIALSGNKKYSDKFEVFSEDIEAVWFPEIRGFATQGHPEWEKPTSKYVQWCLEKSEELWDDK